MTGPLYAILPPADQTDADSDELLGRFLDYEHYLDKQIGAVAEPVLTLRGLDLEQVLGTAKQLRLF